MKRLYYLSPSLTSTDSISKDLHEQGIIDWNFHVISKDDAGIYTHHLNSATTFQRTDVVRYAERGVIAGGLVGLLFFFPLTYLETYSLNIWLSICFFCMFFGAWSGGIGGISRENYKIHRFHDEFSNGQYLIMVDVRKKDEATVQSIMSLRHPEASLQGFDSTFNNPFAAAPT